MIETVTFILAFAGFALLAVTAGSAAAGRHPRVLWGATALVVLTHVALVWTDRYGWSFAQATRNGYAGFALFHGALLSLVVANLAPFAVARWCVLFTFAAVCLGANGAVYRYDVVAVYRWPVLVVSVLGWLAIGRAWRRRRPAAE